MPDDQNGENRKRVTQIQKTIFAAFISVGGENIADGQLNVDAAFPFRSRKDLVRKIVAVGVTAAPDWALAGRAGRKKIKRGGRTRCGQGMRDAPRMLFMKR